MKKSQIYTFYGIILTSILAFYGMNMIVPFYGDDILSKYNLFQPHIHISSLKDILQAVVDDYLYICGRMASSFFCHFFPTLAGEQAFNIVNTIFFIVLLALGYKFCKPQDADHHLPTLIWLTIGTFLLSNDGSSLFYWMAGGINYLWSFVATLSFLYFFHSDNTRLSFIPSKAYPLFALGGMVAALFHEMFAITISGTLLVSYVHAFLYPKLLPYSPKLGQRQHWLAGGYLTGSVIAIFSPSMIGRAIVANETFTAMSFLHHTTRIFLSFHFFVLLACFLLFVYIRKRAIFKSFIQVNAFYFQCLLFSLLPAIISGEGGRALFATEAFSMLLSIRLWNHLMVKQPNHPLSWLYILGASFIVFYGLVMYESHQKWTVFQQTVKAYMSQKDSIVGYSYIKGMPFIRLFTKDLEELMRIRGVRYPIQLDKERMTGKSARMINPVDKRELEDMKQSHAFFIHKNHVAGAFYTRDGYPDYIARYDSTLIKNIAEERLYCIFSLPFNLPFNLKVNYLKSDFYAAVPIRVVGNKKAGRFVILSKNYKHFPMTRLLDMGISPKANTQKFEFVSH